MTSNAQSQEDLIFEQFNPHKKQVLKPVKKPKIGTLDHFTYRYQSLEEILKQAVLSSASSRLYDLYSSILKTQNRVDIELQQEDSYETSSSKKRKGLVGDASQTEAIFTAIKVSLLVPNHFLIVSVNKYTGHFMVQFSPQTLNSIGNF